MGHGPSLPAPRLFMCRLNVIGDRAHVAHLAAQRRFPAFEIADAGAQICRRGGDLIKALMDVGPALIDGLDRMHIALLVFLDRLSQRLNRSSQFSDGLIDFVQACRPDYLALELRLSVRRTRGHIRGFTLFPGERVLRRDGLRP